MPYVYWKCGYFPNWAQSGFQNSSSTPKWKGSLCLSFIIPFLGWTWVFSSSPLLFLSTSRHLWCVKFSCNCDPCSKDPTLEEWCLPSPIIYWGRYRECPGPVREKRIVGGIGSKSRNLIGGGLTFQTTLAIERELKVFMLWKKLTCHFKVQFKGLLKVTVHIIKCSWRPEIRSWFVTLR